MELYEREHAFPADFGFANRHQGKGLQTSLDLKLAQVPREPFGGRLGFESSDGNVWLVWNVRPQAGRKVASVKHGMKCAYLCVAHIGDEEDVASRRETVSHALRSAQAESH